MKLVGVGLCFEQEQQQVNLERIVSMIKESTWCHIAYSNHGCRALEVK